MTPLTHPITTILKASSTERLISITILKKVNLSGAESKPIFKVRLNFKHLLESIKNDVGVFCHWACDQRGLRQFEPSAGSFPKKLSGHIGKFKHRNHQGENNDTNYTPHKNNHERLENGRQATHGIFDLKIIGVTHLIQHFF